jgi:hypothetical protein
LLSNCYHLALSSCLPAYLHQGWHTPRGPCNQRRGWTGSIAKGSHSKHTHGLSHSGFHLNHATHQGVNHGTHQYVLLGRIHCWTDSYLSHAAVAGTQYQQQALTVHNEVPAEENKSWSKQDMVEQEGTKKEGTRKEGTKKEGTKKGRFGHGWVQKEEADKAWRQGRYRSKSVSAMQLHRPMMRACSGTSHIPALVVCTYGAVLLLLQRKHTSALPYMWW